MKFLRCLWRYCYLIEILYLGSIGMALGAQNSVVVWGGGATNVPENVTNVASVAMGSDYCIAVLRDGTLRKWGSWDTNVPPAATNVASVSAAGRQFVVLRRDGIVVNQQGVLSASNAVTAVAAESYGAGAVKSDGVFVGWDGLWSPASNTSNVVAVAKGGYATLRVLLSDGTISPIPPSLSEVPTNIVTMAEGSYATFLRSDGTVVSSSSQSNILSALSNIIAVASGSAHGLGLTRDGSVVAWGGDSSLQTNVPVGLSNVVAIAAGGGHSLALKADGTVVAWGNNSSGQTNVPMGLTNVAVIFAGPNCSIAIVGASPPALLTQPPDETIWSGRPVTFTVKAVGSCPLRFQWQRNGETIEGATNSFYRIDSAVPADSGIYSVLVSNARGTAFSREAALWVRPDPDFATQPTNQTLLLGENAAFYTRAEGSQPVSYQWFFEGQLIPGETNSTLMLTNISLGQAGHYWVTASNASGIETSVVMTLTPRVIATWGSAWSKVNELPDNLLRVASIAAGGGNTYVLTPGGTGVFWGQDDYVWPGMHIAGLSNIVAVAPGWEFVLILLTDGSVVARGLNNDHGQCNVPAGLSDIVGVSAGAYHSLALRTNGSVVAWGDNSYGATSVPAGLTDAIGISAGGYHSLALRADGSVVAWGYGELGATNVPSGLSHVVAVAAGGHHSLALCDDGKIVAWGYNYYGQTNVPTGLSNVVAIAAGFYHSLALRSDGTVIGWGANDYLQSTVPPSLRNVVAIAAGHSHSIALRAEGLVAPPVQVSNVFRSGSNFCLQTPTIRGKSYYLQHCDSLGSSHWTMRPPVPGDGRPRTLIDPGATVPQRFYRVWQQP
jgi:alpha-tubulin suppressor-like RCC1 family protein